MAKATTPAKTPTVAIARALRSVGLKQGDDFRVKGEYAAGMRVGTVAVIRSAKANQTVADNADLIEQRTADEGFHVNVSIHFSPGGSVWVWVSNIGERTRQTHFLSPIGRTTNTATEAPQPATKAPAFDPYAGLVRRKMDGLVWGCAEAGQAWFYQTVEHGPRYVLRMYSGRAFANGWYLSGPGFVTDAFMAGSLSVAAARAAYAIKQLGSLVQTMNDVVAEFPLAMRVQGVDNYGVTLMGSVNGVAWGAVTDPSHENYGRTWVDVDWDEAPHNKGTGRRSRPFTDSLIKH